MELLEVLSARNLWWKTGSISEEFAPQLKRLEFSYLVKELEERRITGIYGPRRVGKTTLMHQLIDFLLKNGTEPKNIIYVSLDDPALEIGNLEDILNVYQKLILKKELQEFKERIFFFIDEAQYLSGWERWLKRYFDMKLPIKFIISGSSALLLHERAKEYLIGRILEFEIPPLNFLGYLKFHSFYNNRDITSLENVISKVKQKTFLEDAQEFYKVVDEHKYDISKDKGYIELLLDDYIQRGGFPESFETKNLEKWYNKLISDVLSKIIYRDIVEARGIKAPKNVERLLLLIAEQEGQTFSYSSISRNLGIDKESVVNYLEYLKDAFIVSESLLYAKSLEKQIRANKKLFIRDSGLRNALLLDFDILQKPKLGLVLESIVRNHCKKLNPYYWRSQSRYEVDIVIGLKEPLPIEVKYTDKIDEKDLKGLKRFMEEFKVKNAVVITKSKLEVRDNILFIPIWLFLLTIGE